MTMTAPLTLDAVNAASRTEFVEQLRGIWEHSPWVVERAADARPFASVAALNLAMTGIVRDAPPEHQLELLRAHPELAGKAISRDPLRTRYNLENLGTALETDDEAGIASAEARKKTAKGIEMDESTEQHN